MQYEALKKGMRCMISIIGSMLGLYGMRGMGSIALYEKWVPGPTL